MKTNKLFCVLVLTLCSALNTYAYDFNVNGIYYNITSDTTVAVTHYNYYKGDIVIPPIVSYNSVDYSVTSIGDYAFSECSGLTSITIPNSVTSIGISAFEDCSGLTSITIPNSVTSIGDAAFRYCSGLTSITIPNSVTSIGNSAFQSCSGLTSVTMGNSVTSIGSSAFAGCYRLTTINVLNSVPLMCGIATFYCNVNDTHLRDAYDIYTYATLHVPMGSVELYSSAHDWRYFNKIKEDMASNGNVYYVNLVVQQGTTGYTRQAIKAAEKYTIYIGSLGDNKVNAVTFNGVDVTDEVKDGYYTTPELKSESVLSVSYEAKTSDVKSTTLGQVRITGYDGEINIHNIDVASDVRVYTVDGKFVGSIPSALGNVSLQVSSNQLYVVKIGEHIYKIAL